MKNHYKLALILSGLISLLFLFQNCGTRDFDIGQYSASSVTPGTTSVPNKPPVILNKSPNLMLNENETAVFSVLINGTAPFNFTWYKNGQKIEALNEPSFTLTGLKKSDEGTYAVNISNAHGSISTTFELFVNQTLIPQPVGVPPTIIGQPSSVLVFLRNSFHLQVVALGQDLRYQWYFTPQGETTERILTGATNSIYSVGVALYSHAGQYRVKVSNSSGEVFSNSAYIFVEPNDIFDLR